MQETEYWLQKVSKSLTHKTNWKINVQILSKVSQTSPIMSPFLSVYPHIAALMIPLLLVPSPLSNSASINPALSTGFDGETMWGQFFRAPFSSHSSPSLTSSHLLLVVHILLSSSTSWLQEALVFHPESLTTSLDSPCNDLTDSAKAKWESDVR